MLVTNKHIKFWNCLLIRFLIFLDRKGNSLFAEVDDQRQQMKSILHNQKIHYMEMKKAYNAKEMEIRRLKRENCNIKQEIQTCSNLFKRSDQVLLRKQTMRQFNRNLEIKFIFYFQNLSIVVCLNSCEIIVIWKSFQRPPRRISLIWQRHKIQIGLNHCW